MRNSSSTKEDEKRYRYLYEKYVVVLRYFGSKYIKDVDVVADIVQDSYIALWGNRELLVDENDSKSFLYKVVKNGCIDYLRKEQVTDKYVDYITNQESIEENFLENILRAETFQALRNIFNELTPMCKEVYKLSLEGRSHKEIASTLNITINTVKKHKNNANRYMRERMKKFLSIFL